MQIIDRIVSMMVRYTDDPKIYSDRVLKDLAYFVDTYGAGFGYDNFDTLCSRDLRLHAKEYTYDIYRLQNAVYDTPMTKLAEQVLLNKGA